MKKIYYLITCILILVFLTRCNNLNTNNPYINWAPGINPNYNSGICDQDRTKVCEMFGDLDIAYKAVSMYMVFKMDKEDSLAVLVDARKYTRPGVLSGELLKQIVGDNERVKQFSYIAYQLGFSITDGINSTNLFDEASCATLNKYYDKLEWEINTFASMSPGEQYMARLNYFIKNG